MFGVRSSVQVLDTSFGFGVTHAFQVGVSASSILQELYIIHI